ncbi:MAG: hypothetical protein U9R23_05130 [Candidatus Cloacimonadota bacterium]|nr:hypothetical protein [Candidatus Cloacimonadota bacterium]
MKKKNFISSFLKAIKSFSKGLPIMLGVILCMGLFQVYISKQLLKNVFVGRVIQDTFLGSIIGSITAGNPINSYIIGKQLLDNGVSLFAVTAFIICWVSVGIVQLPYEVSIMGKSFALSRNLVSFFLSFFVSIATVFVLQVL